MLVLLLFLPPASEGWGKVIFSLCVSVYTSMRGTPFPGQDEGEGTPFPCQDGGGAPLPRSGWGVPPVRTGWGRDMRYPFPGQDGKIPHPRAGWGTPCQDWMGYPHWDWIGVPPVSTGWSTPWLRLDGGYPIPGQDGATPIGPGWDTPSRLQGLSCIKTSTHQTFLDTIIQTSSAQKGAFKLLSLG